MTPLPIALQQRRRNRLYMKPFFCMPCKYFRVSHVAIQAMDLWPISLQDIISPSIHVKETIKQDGTLSPSKHLLLSLSNNQELCYVNLFFPRASIFQGLCYLWSFP